MPRKSYSCSNDGGKTYINVHYAQLAVLQDIRDELQIMNAVLRCKNTTDIPRILRRISANTYRAKTNKPP